MSSNRVRYTNEDAFGETIKTIVNKFQAEVTEEEIVENFRKNLERTLRLNMRYVGSEHMQPKDQTLDEGAPNERLTYYNDVLYPQMTSMLLQVTKKRQTHPIAISNLLREKFTTEQKIIKMKKEMTIVDGGEKKVNEDVNCEEVANLATNSMKVFGSFNQEAAKLKERVNHLIHAKQCVNHLFSDIDTIGEFQQI